MREEGSVSRNYPPGPTNTIRKPFLVLWWVMCARLRLSSYSDVPAEQHGTGPDKIVFIMG